LLIGPWNSLRFHHQGWHWAYLVWNDASCLNLRRYNMTRKKAWAICSHVTTRQNVQFNHDRASARNRNVHLRNWITFLQ
jgi:hypothetical protein